MNTNLACQEERRQELIGGKVVMMSPRPSWNHVSITDNLYTIFSSHLRGRKCRAISDGFELHLSEDNVFIPDMMVICDRRKIKPRGVFGAPDLVVEVLSPSTAKNDRGCKKSVYERSGVPEYWIVDPTSRSIEVYLLENGRYMLGGLYTLYPAEELAEMTDEEKATVITEFKCYLFDDLTIRLDDVFGDLF